MVRLESGTPYSLKEIFCGENDKIIIPDLQRDYCWGNALSQISEESLASLFLDSIIELDKSKDITMGLIYGYYDQDLMPYHLQLCDGQQRLTTLFLILGVINRKAGDNRYQKILISDFEYNEDDKEPHLLYAIRESSLYFLSDLTIHYFLNSELSLEDLDKQPWFLNTYKEDPTISSIRKAIKTIESKLENYTDVCSLGDFLIERLKFLFYDMNNRQNGEETFVVINTTGEPLSADQNLKPRIIRENCDYQRITPKEDGTQTLYNAANDWENMETWFWQNRRKNDFDTSTEGMLAFLHCVRVLECQTEKDWHLNYETDEDKFPVSIKMDKIWKWFCAYKRIYELNYDRLSTPKILYPESQKHYTQKDLYALLPTMQYCEKFQDASDEDVQRIYHLFSNMGRYRYVYRSSQNEAINVPAFRLCQMVKELEDKDILAFLEVDSFDVEEEKKKLRFLRKYVECPANRKEIEELFARAENFSIYDGQIATLVDWTESSMKRPENLPMTVTSTPWSELSMLNYLFNKIEKLWNDTDKVSQALLAYGVEGYPMPTGTANLTLCFKTEWRDLFEERGEQILSFLFEKRDIDTIIADFKDTSSLYYPLVHNISCFEFSQEKKIRIHDQDVIEVMQKKTANGQFWLLHRGCVFPKDMVNMECWNGFKVWCESGSSVFYTMSLKYNMTLDMEIIDEGYQIIAWLTRRPALPSVDTFVLSNLGFEENKAGDGWILPIIEKPEDAKQKFIEVTQKIGQ